MKTKSIVPLAFKKLSQSKNKFEEVIDATLSNNNENTPSYSEEDFGLIDEPSFQKATRTDSGIKLLKVNYLSTIQQIKPDFKFSISTKPRRNLTSP